MAPFQHQPQHQRAALHEASAPANLTLAITAGGSPLAGKFFEDIGWYAIRGTVSTKQAGQHVAVYYSSPYTKGWVRTATLTTAAGGAYAYNKPVGYAATVRFRATTGGVPSAAGVTSSNEVRVTSINSYVVMTRPAHSIDSLKNPTISGYVYPARSKVKIIISIKKSASYTAVSSTSTDRAGKFRTALAYGKGHLATYSVQSSYRATNRKRYEISKHYSIKRSKVLNAVVTKTTAAEVAKTYRAGCPVGRSKLSTMAMNYYGFDKLMHRGILILRSNLTAKAIRGFNNALVAGYPVAKMYNPNVYGGNDPKQMAANNTSGFNCRKVVGNPYSQSPHSYGIAIDVNTVQNPYRDRNGKWWPTNGRSYIDRSPRRKGMLVYNSYLTKQLRKDKFFWGGLWNPGRDYQHFEYHG